jgi:hypothetical protein
MKLPDGRPAISPISALAEVVYNTERILAEMTAPQLDYAKLAQSVAAALPNQHIDVPTLVKAVADELARRMGS